MNGDSALVGTGEQKGLESLSLKTAGDGADAMWRRQVVGRKDIFERKKREMRRLFIRMTLALDFLRLPHFVCSMQCSYGTTWRRDFNDCIPCVLTIVITRKGRRAHRR